MSPGTLRLPHPFDDVRSMTDREHIDVLIIEDDEDDFFIARSLLSKTTGVRCDLEWAQSYEEGLAAITSKKYDVCLVDYRLGARNGLQLLREANELGCDTPMILLTGQGDLQVDLDAMAAGAVDYLVKGQIDAQLLERSIRYARERKRAEERIREQAALLDKARDAICAFDLNRQVIYWNKSAERITGWSAEEIGAQESDAVLYEPGYQKIEEAWQAVMERGEWTGDLRQLSKDGQELIVESRWTLVRDSTGNPRSVLVINTDITERKKLESQFLRAQRMESIGTLVGGIAHDLGNLLVPILLGVKVLGQRYSDEPKTARTLEMIRRSAQRGSDMVKQVLAFARGVEGERARLQPLDVVHEVEKITQEAFPASIRFNFDVPDDLWPVVGDATQLQQVLMNLCVNARDAMPEGGRLTIEAENLIVDESLARTNLEAKPGKYVRIAVTDTGSGIPADVLDKVFEPFFTTKPTGKGTGLGLSTVYSIIKSHGGFVTVYSELGEGTCFSIYLPASENEEPVRTNGEVRDSFQGNGELILVIDDEEYILEAAHDILESSGYRVVTAENGRQGVDVFREREDEIRAVITDLMMPEMDGVAAIRALREIAPHLPIVAASGMTSGKVRESQEAGANLFISKPFTAEKLLSSLHNVLHTNGTKVEG